MSIPLKIALCGACLKGNLGGPALYIAMVESLKKINPDIDVTVISKYPKDDKEPVSILGWNMVSYPTITQIILGVPFFLLFLLFRKLKLPRKWLALGPLRVYLTNDLLIDLSGISFTDDRDLSGLLINSLWLLPAIATGIPWVKASQAMGPFKRPIVHYVSRLILPRASAIVARGRESQSLVQQLLPKKKIYELPDVAVLLRSKKTATVDKLLLQINAQDGFCTVGPSFVVSNAFQKVSVDYSLLMANLCDHLAKSTQWKIVLVPHCRATSTSHWDDIDVCEKIYDQSKSKERIFVLRQDLDVQEVKSLIANSKVAIGSRFHFIVAALSSSIPCIAVGWSHKYYELMEMFGQEEFALNYKTVTEDILFNLTDRLITDLPIICDQIQSHLPNVKALAEMNAHVSLELLKK